MNRIAAVVAGLSLASVGTSATYAATHTVCPSGCDYTSIQDAISASVDHDVITIAPGIFHEHRLDLGGKAITIQGTRDSNGALATTIDAGQHDDVFEIHSGEGNDTVIKDLMITGCGVTGIYTFNSSPIIIGCQITGNTSWDVGGGIQCDGTGATQIIDCTITDNTALKGGGIMCRQPDAVIRGCVITGNTASEGFGGGIYCGEGHPTITDCTITDNTAHHGGGGIFLFEDNSSSISHCTISGNTSRGEGLFPGGGGIYIFPRGTPAILDCTISDNTTNRGSGGGLYVYISAKPTITSCTITGNHAPHGSGGGIYCDVDSQPTVIGGTISGNSPHGIFRAHESSRGDAPDVGHVILEDAMVCGNGNATSVLQVAGMFMHFGETRIANDCDPGTDTGDLDEDGDVDTDDLSALHSVLGVCTHDTNHDGITGIDDLLDVIEGWDQSCTP
ncbi:MAG: right-handed parallel beta-helix repeat-containing protein [Phycisphaerales bacterium]|nr:right-handed parallel beta-helix repeat-containing protein [Phycisphaerales bacterium]